MSQWLSPDGIMTLLMVVVLVLSIAKNVRQALKARDTNALVGTFSLVAAAVIEGVETAKKSGGMTPASVVALTETLRAANRNADTEATVRPMIEAVRAGATSEEVAAKAVREEKAVAE